MSYGFNIFSNFPQTAYQAPVAPAQPPAVPGYQVPGYQAPALPSYPGVNITQLGYGNFNLAVGTPGNDNINQSGANGLFLAYGLGGNNTFGINGSNNTSIQTGTNGNDTFTAGGSNGFYKIYGGAGVDTLTLQGNASNWVKQNANTYFNPSTNTSVFAFGIENIRYA